MQVWLLSYRKDLIRLERVHKRFTRVLPRFADLCYRERLNRLLLFALEHRLRGDFIEMYNKIMRSMDKVNNSLQN